MFVCLVLRCKKLSTSSSGIIQKKKKSKLERQEIKPKPKLKIGDRVRMFDGRSVGSIDSIEKNKVIVNYGVFTTQVNADLLELVESEKIKK